MNSSMPFFCLCKRAFVKDEKKWNDMFVNLWQDHGDGLRLVEFQPACFLVMAGSCEHIVSVDETKRSVSLRIMNSNDKSVLSSFHFMKKDAKDEAVARFEFLRVLTQSIGLIKSDVILRYVEETFELAWTECTGRNLIRVEVDTSCGFPTRLYICMVHLKKRAKDDNIVYIRAAFNSRKSLEFSALTGGNDWYESARNSDVCLNVVGRAETIECPDGRVDKVVLYERIRRLWDEVFEWAVSHHHKV